MKSKRLFLVLMLLLSAATLRAQQPQSDLPGESLFPPDLVMEHLQALGLSEEQMIFLETEVHQAQARLTELQEQLQAEAEKMIELVKQDRVNESQTLTQLDKIINLEREIKRAQIALLIRIKNKLSPEQQAKLREAKNKPQGR